MGIEKQMVDSIGKIENTYNNLISKIANMTENDARAFLTGEINKSSVGVDAEDVANVVEYIINQRLIEVENRTLLNNGIKIAQSDCGGSI